jgi:hypothetical protein
MLKFKYNRARESAVVNFGVSFQNFTSHIGAYSCLSKKVLLRRLGSLKRIAQSLLICVIEKGSESPYRLSSS